MAQFFTVPWILEEIDLVYFKKYLRNYTNKYIDHSYILRRCTL